MREFRKIEAPAGLVTKHLDPTSARILLVLIDRASEDGTVSASTTQVASWSNVAPTSVKDKFPVLEKAGVISRAVPKRGEKNPDGSQKTTVFTVNYDRFADYDDDEPRVETAATVYVDGLRRSDFGMADVDKWVMAAVMQGDITVSEAVWVKTEAAMITSERRR